MKTLNRTAAKTFRALIYGLAPGEARTIGDGIGYMAVQVDCLTPNLFAVAHRYEQNGDLMPDPDVEFYVTDLGVAPTAIDQSFGYQRSVWIEDGKPARIAPRAQASLTAFCNTWMRNISAQQDLSALTVAA